MRLMGLGRIALTVATNSALPWLLLPLLCFLFLLVSCCVSSFFAHRSTFARYYVTTAAAAVDVGADVFEVRLRRQQRRRRVNKEEFSTDYARVL